MTEITWRYTYIGAKNLVAVMSIGLPEDTKSFDGEHRVPRRFYLSENMAMEAGLEDSKWIDQPIIILKVDFTSVSITSKTFIEYETYYEEVVNRIPSYLISARLRYIDKSLIGTSSRDARNIK